MSTLAEVIDWVATDMLKRGDLDTVITNAAVNFYKVLTRKVPFDELMITSAERPLVAGQVAYELADLVPALNAIMSIRLTYGPANSNSLRLRRSSTRLYDALSYTQPGQSATYARWGTQIELNPPPQGSNWTYRVRYWSKVTIAGTASTTVIAVDDAWLELMKWETLYRTYYALQMYQEAAMLVMPPQYPRQGSPIRQIISEPGIIPKLWNELLSTISAKENGDEDFSINPVVRPYSLS